MHLVFGGDVVEAVVGHRQAVAIRLVAFVLVAAAGAGQAIQIVVGKGLRARAADFVAGAELGAGEGDAVGELGEVADIVITVGEVLEAVLAALGQGPKVLSRRLSGR